MVPNLTEPMRRRATAEMLLVSAPWAPAPTEPFQDRISKPTYAWRQSRVQRRLPVGRRRCGVDQASLLKDGRASLPSPAAYWLRLGRAFLPSPFAASACRGAEGIAAVAVPGAVAWVYQAGIVAIPML